jgi:predicted dehydrogenase
MGSMNLTDFQSFPQVEIIGLCDVDSNQIAKAQKLITGKPPQVEQDYRRILERKDIDAVIVATPDHWHALIAVQACQSGKDVYVEKPPATSVREGRLMVEAARRNNRVMQVGIQQRSGSHFQRAVKLVQSGAIGTVVYAEAWNHGRTSQEGIGRKQPSRPPDGLNWDMWLGPAPLAPYRSNIHPVMWRGYYDYGGGNLADWGVHLLDIIQWALKLEAPQSVQANGGRYWTNDDRTVPDTMNVVYQYPGAMVNFTHMNHCNYGRSGKFYGIIFHGSDAALVLDRGGYDIIPVTTKYVDPSGENYRGAFDDMVGTGTYFVSARPAEHGSTSLQHRPHVDNFLSCLKSRERPIGDIDIGHRAALPCHLGNISYRVKQRLEWDGEKERITNSEEANALLTRQYRAPWNLPGLES